ncbi:unnamed protein product, partial [Polarella glacialis]
MSCRVLHRGVEEAVLRRVAEDAQVAGLERILIPVLPTLRNGLMRGFLGRVSTWANVPPAEEGPSVTFGRYGDRRGAVAAALDVPTSQLQQLRGEHTTCDGDADEQDAEAE